MKQMIAFVIFTFFCVSSLLGVENSATTLAKLSANGLYQLDKTALKNTLEPYIKENKKIPHFDKFFQCNNF